jgi:probable phosphoglycerate mutase
MALTMDLHFVRHGQSEWNVAGRLQGQTSHPKLTALGRRQARAAAGELARMSSGHEPIERVLSSDLVRAAQTAEIIGVALGRPVELEPRLREQAMGTLEGLPSAQAFEAAAGVTWSESAQLGGRTSESMRDVAVRVGAVLSELMTGPDRSVVLVSHGDTIRIAIAWLAATAADREFGWESFGLANASITTARLVDGVVTDLTSTRTGAVAPD